MALLTTVKNGAIQGASTTLANAYVNKEADGDTLIVFDVSTTSVIPKTLSNTFTLVSEAI